MTKLEFKVHNLEETRELAKKVAKLIRIYDVITLQGDLGSGKTTFSKLLINFIAGPHHNVTSPTFNLVHNYTFAQGAIWHFDLYRLKESEEIYELGLDEALENITIIEWPEIINYILPKDRLEIVIKYDIDGTRTYFLTLCGKWQDRINEIRHDK
jgi:tRNA threonylcarbamoyladenosine biosynthesis protein TsaE